MLDTVRSVTTPEGVHLELQLAGPPVRALAWLVDVLLRMVVYGAMSIPLSLMGDMGVGAYFLLVFLGEWGYPVFFEVLQGGATPGKKMFKLRVLHDDGTPVGLAASSVRNLLRFADFLPAAFGAGLVTMSFHPQFKRLGDLAAGTVVAYRAEEPGSAKLPAMTPERPPISLSLAEQRAVVDYATRLGGWTDSRANELASLVGGLTGAKNIQSRDRLVAFANWLVGKR